MKKWRLAAFVLVICLLCSACGGAPEDTYAKVVKATQAVNSIDMQVDIEFFSEYQDEVGSIESSLNVRQIGHGESLLLESRGNGTSYDPYGEYQHKFTSYYRDGILYQELIDINVHTTKLPVTSRRASCFVEALSMPVSEDALIAAREETLPEGRKLYFELRGSQISSQLEDLSVGTILHLSGEKEIQDARWEFDKVYYQLLVDKNNKIISCKINYDGTIRKDGELMDMTLSFYFYDIIYDGLTAINFPNDLNDYTFA